MFKPKMLTLRNWKTFKCKQSKMEIYPIQLDVNWMFINQA